MVGVGVGVGLGGGGLGDGLRGGGFHHGLAFHVDVRIRVQGIRRVDSENGGFGGHRFDHGDGGGFGILFFFGF